MNAKSSVGLGTCGGFGSLKDWFSDQSSCEDLLPTRLAVLAIGLGVFFTCAYFGEKADREKGRIEPSVARTAPTSQRATASQGTVSSGVSLKANAAPPNRHRGIAPLTLNK